MSGAVAEFALSPRQAFLPRETLSPLRYPGGKGKVAARIMAHFPSGLGRLVSPFFGGGGLELFAAANGAQVFGYDAFEPLVNFWHRALVDSESVADEAEKYYPLQREEFNRLCKSFRTMGDSTARAGAFFALNRASFAGNTFQGIGIYYHRDGVDASAFTPLSLDWLRTFDGSGVSVEMADFQESIARHPDDFVYADPPYAVTNGRLYGYNGELHRHFPHEELARTLLARGGWALSYNDCEMVRDLYAGCRLVEMSWGYRFECSRGRTGRELLILSRE